MDEIDVDKLFEEMDCMMSDRSDDESDDEETRE